MALSKSQQAFVEKVTPAAVMASQETGIDPRVIIAQAALESSWGRSAPGNNYFGIKGSGQSQITTEYIGGQPQVVSANFRTYPTIEASFMDYASLMNRLPRYDATQEARGIAAQTAALGRSGYATDPDYGMKVASIANQIAYPTTAQYGMNPAPAWKDQSVAPRPPAAIGGGPVQVASSSPGPAPENSTIPKGIYGAEVLAAAILTGNPDKIAAAQKVVEANAERAIRAAYASNPLGLLVNAESERAKATAAVTQYLTVTLPKDAPGAVRQLQELVKRDPTLLNGLTPDQRAMLEQAFKALPPAPGAKPPTNPAQLPPALKPGPTTGTVVPPGVPPSPQGAATMPSGIRGGSIVDNLARAGMDSSFAARRALAAEIGIQNYRGTAAQNTALLNAMRTGTINNALEATTIPTPNLRQDAPGYAANTASRYTSSLAGSSYGAQPQQPDWWAAARAAASMIPGVYLPAAPQSPTAPGSQTALGATAQAPNTYHAALQKRINDLGARAWTMPPDALYAYATKGSQTLQESMAQSGGGGAGQSPAGQDYGGTPAFYEEGRLTSPGTAWQPAPTPAEWEQYSDPSLYPQYWNDPGIAGSQTGGGVTIGPGEVPAPAYEPGANIPLLFGYPTAPGEGFPTIEDPPQPGDYRVFPGAPIETGMYGYGDALPANVFEPTFEPAPSQTFGSGTGATYPTNSNPAFGESVTPAYEEPSESVNWYDNYETPTYNYEDSLLGTENSGGWMEMTPEQAFSQYYEQPVAYEQPNVEQYYGYGDDPEDYF